MEIHPQGCIPFLGIDEDKKGWDASHPQIWDKMGMEIGKEKSARDASLYKPAPKYHKRSTTATPLKRDIENIILSGRLREKTFRSIASTTYFLIQISK